MKFKENIQDLIGKRISRRDYSRIRLEPVILKKVFDLAADEYVGLFSSKVRFQFIDTKNEDESKKIKVGTYGMVSGARFYIAAITSRTPKSIIDTGYVFEKLILKLTELGLATCWLGSNLTENSLLDQLNLDTFEFIPAMTPVGYPKIQQTLKEKVVAFGIGARKRQTWDKIFFLDDFETPLTEDDVGKYNIPLEMVRIAPSAKNMQPWRIVKDQNRNIFHFYVDSGFTRSKYDIPKLKLLDIGIAICHFDLTVKEVGCKGRWINQKPDIRTESKLHYISSWYEK